MGGSHELKFKALPEGIVVFGEWCGPGVEKGTAISKIPSKIFAVFSVQVGREQNARLIYDPEQLTTLLSPLTQCSDVHILPWDDTGPVTIDFGQRESMELTMEVLNEMVLRWNRKCMGETNVWSKRNRRRIGFLSRTGFGTAHSSQSSSSKCKAKGEKHRSAATKQAVQVDASVVKNTADFVQLMVTTARLEQGVLKPAVATLRCVTPATS